MGLELGLNYRQELRKEQKLQLKQLLRQFQELKEPGFAEAIRGVEGLKIANDILEKKNLVGLLNGGMAKSICDPRKSARQLANHKDTDVLIFGTEDEYRKIARFEGG